MDSSSSCCIFNAEEEVVVIRNGWTPKNEKTDFGLVGRAPCAGRYGMRMMNRRITRVASSDQDASTIYCCTVRRRAIRVDG